MLVLRSAAGAELNKLSYTVAGTANLSRSLERDTELQIQLDKPAYSGGDTIEVSIRAPYVGAGLITKAGLSIASDIGFASNPARRR